LRVASEQEFAFVESPLQGIEEFASDDLGEGFDGEKEIVF